MMPAGTPETPPTIPDLAGNRLPALDGVRGLAILLVMLHHFSFYSGIRPLSLLDKLIYRTSYAGWVGVDLFFVLSGFLITGILWDARHNEHHYFRNFYMRRVLRIFPLYYGILAIALFLLRTLAPASPGIQEFLDDQIWYWVYALNLKLAVSGWPEFYAFGHFWSLAVEEQFYLFWPLIVFHLRRSTLIALCIAMIVVSPGLRLLFILLPLPDLGAYVLTPARMDALAVGALLALLVRTPQGLHRVRRLAPYVAGSTAILITVLFTWQRGLETESPVVQTLGYSLLALLFGALVALALLHPLPRRLFARRSLVFLGRYSYGLYIFHHPIVLWLALQPLTLPTHAPLIAIGLFSLLALTLSLAAAWLSWHLYEKQFLKLKTWFPYAPLPRTEPPQACFSPPQRIIYERFAGSAPSSLHRRTFSAGCR